MMTLSNNLQHNNEFILGAGKPSKIHPIKHKKSPICMAIITPNQMFLHGLNVEFKARDVVDIITINTSAFNALKNWTQQPCEVSPDIILIDTKQKKLSCREMVMRLKFLCRKTKILVAGDYFRHENIQDYFELGANGYIDQAASGLMFLTAIETVVYHDKQFLHTPLLPFHGHIIRDPYE